MSKARRQDSILYCEKCGISFLWSTEEQNRQQAALEPGEILEKPTHCPGCRLLLPPPGRERGLVKWYNRRKRFGFIARRNQPDLFVHGSQLDGSAYLTPGDLVEFGVIETDKGLAASEVRAVDAVEAVESDGEE